MVDADLREQDVPEKIRAALQKESLFLALATDEPELWHKPFQRQGYAKALGIQTVLVHPRCTCGECVVSSELTSIRIRIPRS